MPVVRMPDGSNYDVKVLLADGDSNTKTRKSDKADKGYLTVSLSLSPANESGYEVCASRSPGCTHSCIFTAGHGVYDNVRKARIAKTCLFFQKRTLFKKMLCKELKKWNAKAKRKGLTLACRLNVFSDIQWEKVFPKLFTEFTDVQFYDYTKHFARAFNYSESMELNTNTFPKNYHLTFSKSEVNDSQVNSIIQDKAKVNIAVVFDSHDIPVQWNSRQVVNGDETDLRFLDPPGTIVGLYAKGRGKKDTSGFVVSTNKVSLEVL